MWLLSFFATGVLVVLSPVLFWYLSVRKYRSLDAIPGPKPVPILGNAPQLGSSPQEILTAFTKYAKEYDNFYRVYVASDMHVVFAKPELLEPVLTSTVHLTKSNGYDLLKPWLGEGLLISAGPKWKTRRRMITPTFHFKILDEFMNVFNSAGDIFIRKLSPEVGKPETDIAAFVNLLSLDIICETALGVKLNAQQNQNAGYVTAVAGFMNIMVVRFFSPWQRFDLPYWLFASSYKAHVAHLKTLHDFTIDVIQKRREERKRRKKSLANASEEGIKRRVALLDMLLESETTHNLSNEDLREEIDTFTFEGHDTTASGMEFALYALSMHPGVQQRLYEEVEAVVGSEEVITMQHLQDMKYLDMFIKEAQRVYPSVPIIERKLETDTAIGGFNYPKGMTVTLNIIAMHNSEEYYPDPEVFDPNRFTPENQAKRHNYAYVPFSAGARNCIGQKFAMFEMKTIVTKVLQNYRVLPVPGFEPDLGTSAVLKSYNGILVKLERRKQ